MKINIYALSHKNDTSSLKISARRKYLKKTKLKNPRKIPKYRFKVKRRKKVKYLGVTLEKKKKKSTK